MSYYAYADRRFGGFDSRVSKVAALTRSHRSVHVDTELLAQLEELARQRAVLVTFAEQVDAGLRLLVQQRQRRPVRRSADVVAADKQRAQQTYRRLEQLTALAEAEEDLGVR